MISYVYMVQCSDKSLYTGWTYNINERLKRHNNGTGAKYTRSRGPVQLVYYEIWPDKREAQQREHAIKQLSRAEKNNLVASFKIKLS